MHARTTSPVAAALRRVISAVMCALMLLSVTTPVKSAASASLEPVGQAELVFTRGNPGGSPIGSDALPCECAHHLCGKVTPVTPTLAAVTMAAMRPGTTPVRAPGPVRLPGFSELPTEPPRA